MHVLETVLGPIVWLMALVLDFFTLVSSSTGIAILLMSFSFALLLFPLQRIAHRSEQRIGEKMKIVDDADYVLTIRMEPVIRGGDPVVQTIYASQELYDQVKVGDPFVIDESKYELDDPVQQVWLD